MRTIINCLAGMAVGFFLVDALFKQRALSKGELTALMNDAASREEYELAAEYRDKIAAL